MTQTYSHDVLVIGSGAAGLTLALSLAKHAKVAVLSKNALNQGSTWFAQGGIAAVLDDQDSIDAHVEDTLIAGAGLCHEDSVRFTVENSKSAIEWLIEQGVSFTKESGKEDYHLTQEGGHSHRRIIHSADATGRAVHSTLIDQVKQQQNIALFEDHIAVNLITQADADSRKLRCTGAYVLDNNTEQVHVFQAKVVVLATGGASKVYLYTTNLDGASGDGIAMAWRAGCRNFLISEALRGEGAYLRLPSGERFMSRFDERLELAPRDIVARAIDHEMKRLGCDCLYLDISHKAPEFIKEHFPTVYARCLELGIDITKEPIPVVPAAHYTCGGVVVDNNGQTDLQNLYAIGETSFTGLHGANRLASNSLLECVVYAQSAGQQIIDSLAKIHAPEESQPWDSTRVTDSDEDVVISHNWDELRRFMWDYVGIVRTHKRLQRASHRIKLLKKEIAEYYSNYKVSSDLIELRNLATVAELIIRSALDRKESRGLHYSMDFPNKSNIARDTILVPTNFAAQNVVVSKDN
jgi:L-aspartate oxidase